MDNYASVLESYLIPAEEGLMDKIKDAGKRVVNFLKSLIDKIKQFIHFLKAKVLKIDVTKRGYDRKINTVIHKLLTEYTKFMMQFHRGFSSLKISGIFELTDTEKSTQNDLYDSMNEFNESFDDYTNTALQLIANCHKNHEVVDPSIYTMAIDILTRNLSGLNKMCEDLSKYQDSLSSDLVKLVSHATRITNRIINTLQDVM